MRQYIALIHKEPGSNYGVSFPDLPGCISAGRTLDDARVMAEEALALHLEGIVEEGGAAPEPSTLEAIMADHDNREGVAVLVPAKTAVSRTVRVNVTIPEDVLAAIDVSAEAHGMNRSGFLAWAAQQQIGRGVGGPPVEGRKVIRGGRSDTAVKRRKRS